MINILKYISSLKRHSYSNLLSVRHEILTKSFIVRLLVGIQRAICQGKAHTCNYELDRTSATTSTFSKITTSTQKIVHSP